MPAFTCSVCVEGREEHEFSVLDEGGEPVCVFCVADYGKTYEYANGGEIGPTPFDDINMAEELGGEIFRAAIEEEDGEFKENPAHVSGVDKFIVYVPDANESIVVMDFVLQVLDLVFRESPKPDMLKLHEIAYNIVVGLRERLKLKLIDEPKEHRIVRRTALILVGYEAKIFLIVLAYMHKRYAMIRRKYLEAFGFDKADFFDRMYWHIGALIRYGTLGKDWRMMSAGQIRTKIRTTHLGW